MLSRDCALDVSLNHSLAMLLLFLLGVFFIKQAGEYLNIILLTVSYLHLISGRMKLAVIISGFNIVFGT